MKIRNAVALSSILVGATVLSGCSSATKALGLKQSAPNEFNIVTKAPLVVPPEYNLRPPQIGESSYENNYTQKAAREALIGDIDDAEPSVGEQYLLVAAGAPRSNQEIRVEIDGQNSVERKTESFSTQVLRGANAPLDAEAEAQRLKSIDAATGGGQVTITRRPGTPKLPGL